MIKQQVLNDLKNKLDEITSNNWLELTRSEYTSSEMREHHQELLAKWIMDDGIYEYSDNLTEAEIDLDSETREISQEYSKYLMENDL